MHNSTENEYGIIECRNLVDDINTHLTPHVLFIWLEAEVYHATFLDPMELLLDRLYFKK